MSFFDNARALADKMLRKYGGAVTLTRTVPGAYDPATSTNAAPTVTVYSGTAVRWNYDTKEIDGTRVLAGDVRLIVSPKTRGGGEFPQPVATTDVVSFGGVSYTVVPPVEIWNYNGTDNCGFVIQARGTS